jgi:hypothetical protein
MRLTEFWRRMTLTFGEGYVDSWARDYVLADLGGRTVVRALADGIAAKDVWRAVCGAVEVDSKLR